MALTPEDVVNKRFQPTKFREGYDQDEVDDFLDEVVVELRRLGQENEELRQRLIASDSRIAELQRSGATESPEAAAPAAAEVPTSVVAEPVPAPAPAAPAEAAATPGLDETGSTNNLLQLARRLHEEHVREGIEKRDALIAEGHATAARVVGEAEAEQRQKVGELESQRSALESQIEELRTFEREYRQNLKGYIEGQLRELESANSLNTGSNDVPAAQNEFGSDFSAPANQPPANFQGFVGN
ncbi:DivIVA domain-containing protein [Homoserinimonas aerilata]|uniref:Cell wall synthesis protein Wag31 n=1 Tax=Homoserinimonas aerilata TaxID=1162970 RepID=A0A542YJ79_9MICO|nr:DivIVA domain-containing protein [Homoserinimonas aerilata]TQL48143.1 DivIVA domain-containing protein [Homoserinimonas aerilata]